MTVAQLTLITPFDESSARFANIVRADRGSVISPRIADIGHDGSGLIVSEEPRECRHSCTRRRYRRRGAERAAQYDVQKRSRIALLHRRRPGQSREQTRRAFAVGLV